MRSLKEFQSQQDVFKTPEDLPAFFDQNLVDPGRIVKVFNDDPQAHIRVFYYQYLKLCFEVTNPKSEELVQKIEELINNPTFQFIFYQEDDQSLFNDTQAKSFVSEFFGELSAAECTVLEAINSYPIMDSIMVHFFRTLMILMDKTESLDNFITRDDLLAFLCPFFSIDVEIHDNCIKYVDTDVFVYDMNERTVFMAYINYTEDNDTSGAAGIGAAIDSKPEVESKEIIEQKHMELGGKLAVTAVVSNVLPEDNGTGSVKAKESYIASEWNDYTLDPAAERLASKGMTLKGSHHQIDRFGKGDQEKASQNTFGVPEPKLSVPFNPKPLAFVETNSMSSGSDTRNMLEAHTSVTVQESNNQAMLARSNPINRQAVNAPHPTPAPIPSVTQIQPSPSVNKPYPSPSAHPTSSPSTASQQQQSFQQPMQQPVQQSFQQPMQQPFQQPMQQPFQQQPIPTKDRPDPSKFNQFNPAGSPSKQMNPPQVQAKDLMYSPKVESPLYNPTMQSPNLGSPKPDPYASKYNTEAVSKTQYGGQQNGASQYGGNQYGGSNVTANVPAAGGKKKVFGLNVSDEFTNSFTIKKMAEPFKSNVTSIKSRARTYRNSLSSYLK